MTGYNSEQAAESAVSDFMLGAEKNVFSMIEWGNTHNYGKKQTWQRHRRPWWPWADQSQLRSDRRGPQPEGPRRGVHRQKHTDRRATTRRWT